MNKLGARLRKLVRELTAGRNRNATDPDRVAQWLADETFVRLSFGLGLFDPAFYAATVSGLETAPEELLSHYLSDGARAGLDPSAHFDTKWYLGDNPDVASSPLNPLYHFVRHGRAEGRSPLPKRQGAVLRRSVMPGHTCTGIESIVAAIVAPVRPDDLDGLARAFDFLSERFPEIPFAVVDDDTSVELSTELASLDLVVAIDPRPPDLARVLFRLNQRGVVTLGVSSDLGHLGPRARSADRPSTDLLRRRRRAWASLRVCHFGVELGGHPEGWPERFHDNLHGPDEPLTDVAPLAELRRRVERATLSVSSPARDRGEPQYRLGPLLRTGARRLKILTHRWHVPHQYELHRLPHDFTMVTGTGTPFTDRWAHEQRPKRPNARFVPLDEIRSNDFDLAIVHFDENVLCPELSNGVLPESWGACFRWFLEERALPLIAVCHGTPPFVGQYGAEAGLVETFEPHVAERERLVAALRDAHVVVNSHQANDEWGFERSTVIHHGMDPHDFPNGRHQRDVVGHGVDRHRPHYRGAHLFSGVVELLADEIDVHDHEHPGAALLPTDAPGFDQASFRAWVDHLGAYKVYLNCTLRSPMPRSRTEAMLCGCVPVTTPNHDAAMFIRQGVNGFCGRSAAELAEHARYVCRHPLAAERMSREARQTAIDHFHVSRFLDDWHRLLERELD